MSIFIPRRWRTYRRKSKTSSIKFDNGKVSTRKHEERIATEGNQCHSSIIQIGATAPSLLDRWRIIRKEFREDLEWAVIVSGKSEISPAVAQLLDELSACGIVIHEFGVNF